MNENLTEQQLGLELDTIDQKLKLLVDERQKLQEVLMSKLKKGKGVGVDIESELINLNNASDSNITSKLLFFQDCFGFDNLMMICIKNSCRYLIDILAGSKAKV